MPPLNQLLPLIILGFGVAFGAWGLVNLRSERRFTRLSAVIGLALGVALLTWLVNRYVNLPAEFWIVLALAGGLVVWGVVNPAVGRRLARVFAVLAIAAGVGLLVWGITATTRGERARAGDPMTRVEELARGTEVTAAPRCPIGGPFTEASEVIGAGAGCLTAGVIALVLSFIGRKAGPAGAG